jgi:hypothetical protein
MRNIVVRMTIGAVRVGTYNLVPRQFSKPRRNHLPVHIFGSFVVL